MSKGVIVNVGKIERVIGEYKETYIVHVLLDDDSKLFEFNELYNRIRENIVSLACHHGGFWHFQHNSSRECYVIAEFSCIEMAISFVEDVKYRYHEKKRLFEPFDIIRIAGTFEYSLDILINSKSQELLDKLTDLIRYFGGKWSYWGNQGITISGIYDLEQMKLLKMALELELEE